MPRTGGDETRRRILETAETLFARSGFDGTSIDRIAKLTGINKATIYYHFRDKADLIETLFRDIVDNIDAAVGEELPVSAQDAAPDSAREEEKAIRGELEYLAGKKNILAILFTEALKEDSDGSVLFQCAEKALRREHPDLDGMTKEFFTGFVPLIVFVLFREKFARHFELRDEDLLSDFLAAFRESHLEGKA